MTNKLNNITRYTIFALLIFTPLARGAVQGWAGTVIHMATLIALAAFFLEKNLTQSWHWIRTPLDKPVLILVILSILSAFFSVHKPTSFWSTILLFSFIAIYYLVIHTVRTRTQLKHLVYLIVGIAAFLSIFGFLKISGNNPFPWWEYPEITQSVNRLASTYGNANHLAGHMEMSILLLLGFLFIGLKGVKRFAVIALFILLFSALVLSLSRGGWAGAFFGFSFMVVVWLDNYNISKKKVLLIFAVGLLVSLFVVLSSTSLVMRINSSIELIGTPDRIARLKVWEGIIEMIKDHPLLGTGPGTFSTVFSQYQPQGVFDRHFMAHNDYLHFTSETGVFLVVVVVWMIIALYRHGFNKLKHPSRLVRGVTLGSMSGITAILVHSISDFNLHIPANALLFTVLAALVASPIPETNSRTEPD